MYRVEIDVQRCQSNAMCMAVAPGVFALGDDDLPHVTVGKVDDAHLPDVLRAVDACPQRAISLVEA